MTTDEEIMLALVGQVARAAAGDNEQKVVTFITRPMWNAFCRATKIPENSEPTPWKGIHDTRRVYGSETIVIESDKFVSFSTKILEPS